MTIRGDHATRDLITFPFALKQHAVQVAAGLVRRDREERLGDQVAQYRCIYRVKSHLAIAGQLGKVSIGQTDDFVVHLACHDLGVVVLGAAQHQPVAWEILDDIVQMLGGHRQATFDGGIAR